jgi:hypothetical protein
MPSGSAVRWRTDHSPIESSIAHDMLGFQGTRFKIPNENHRARERSEAGFLQTSGPRHHRAIRGTDRLGPWRKVSRNKIRVTKAEALPVKKPKKPKVKSSSAIQKKPNQSLSPLQEPIQNPAKSLPQTNTAGQQPQDQQMNNPPKRWSLMKRAVAVVVAVVGLIAPTRRKRP